MNKLIEQNPQRWADFIAGIQWMYPTEVPPMLMARRAFVEHLNQKEKATIHSSGHIQYVDKKVKLNPTYGYKEFKTKQMENLKHLEQWVRNLGWYSGKLNLIIKTEHEFEGFYGKASETWESRVSISISKIEERGKIIVPDLEMIGHRGDDINSVAGKLLAELKAWGYGPGK